MRQIIAFLLIATLFTGIVVAQTPEGFSYQTIVRDANGNIWTNQNVSFRFSLLENSTSGTVVYTETHSVVTNDLGLVNLVVGNGTATTGTFANVDWSVGKIFLKVDVDINGGSTYTFINTTQLWAVPYALYAEKAGSIDGPGFIEDTTNELQTLSLTGSTLSISQGNSITLPSGVVNTDEQTLGLSGDTLTISNGNSVVLPASAGPDQDEQTLSLSGDTLFISNGNSIVLPSTTTPDLDEQVLSINCDTLFISNGNFIIIPNIGAGTIAYAGPDKLNNSIATITLDAVPPSNGTGEWTIVSGNGGSIVDSSNAKSQFTGQASESYVLRWTVTTACGTSSDDVNFTFGQTTFIPVVNCSTTSSNLMVHPLAFGPREWYNGGSGTSTGAISTSDGPFNTQLIVQAYGAPIDTNRYAAYICDTLTAYGYTDWYLPTTLELICVITDPSVPGFFGNNSNATPWWSSVESGPDYALRVTFPQASTLSSTKSSRYNFRCVRKVQ